MSKQPAKQGPEHGRPTQKTNRKPADFQPPARRQLADNAGTLAVDGDTDDPADVRLREEQDDEAIERARAELERDPDEYARMAEEGQKQLQPKLPPEPAPRR
jgi:hypothetical protein